MGYCPEDDEVLNLSITESYKIAKRWRSDTYGHEKGPRSSV